MGRISEYLYARWIILIIRIIPISIVRVISMCSGVFLYLLLGFILRKAVKQVGFDTRLYLQYTEHLRLKVAGQVPGCVPPVLQCQVRSIDK